MDNTEKYYKTYIDVLTLAASFSVVWIHFGNEIHWYDGTLAWKMCVPIQVFAYWAVPVYFMITGATLMNYRQKYTTTVFFRRRLVRGVMPYLIWGTLMIFLDSERVFVQGSSMAHKTSSILNAFINSTMEPVYWFFIPLLSVYLSMPILSLLAEKQNRKLLHYALALGVLLISVIPFSYNLFYYVFRPEQNFYWNQLLSMPVLGGYTLYCVLGYWAATHNFTKKQRIICYSAGAIAIVFRFAGLWYLSARDGATSRIFMDYLSWPALFQALSVFVACKHTPWDKVLSENAHRIVAKLSRCGLGVYVIHSEIIRKMGDYTVFCKYSPIWYYFWPIPTFLVCILAVALARKIPLLRCLFP